MWYFFPSRWIRHSYPTFTPNHHLTNVTYQAPLEVSLNQVVEKLPFDRELNVPLLVEGYVNPSHTSQSIYEAPSEVGTMSLNHLAKLSYNNELKDSLLASKVGHFNPSRTPHSSSPYQTTFDTEAEAGTMSLNHVAKLSYNNELKDSLLASQEGHFNPSRTPHSSSPFQTTFDTEAEAGIVSLDHLKKLPYSSELKGPLLAPRESYSYPPTPTPYPNHTPHPTYEAEAEGGIVSLNHLEELPYKQLKGPILALREGYSPHPNHTSPHPNQKPNPTYEAPEEAGIVSLDHMEELTRLEIIHLGAKYLVLFLLSFPQYERKIY